MTPITACITRRAAADFACECLTAVTLAAGFWFSLLLAWPE